MALIRLGDAVVLGIILPQVLSISLSSPSPDCLASMDACMSNLCKSEQAFYSGICGDEGCQIKGSEVCNMTVQTALERLPSLRGCACAREEGPCDATQALAAQCHRGPASQEERSTLMDGQSSGSMGYVRHGGGSCLDRVTVCVNDAACNKHLVRVLQACMEDECDRERCRRAARQLFGSVGPGVAEALVMCECEASNRYCAQIRTALHGHTCGGEARVCQHTLNQCVEDGACRDTLRTLRTKCWSADVAQCSELDLLRDECLSRMDPALILGADPECKKAFVATLGTALHYPCSCGGVHNDDLRTCNVIHDVFHNRSHFMTSWKNNSGLSKPPQSHESERGHTWSHDHLLYAFAAVLLVGVVILMPLALVGKIWMLRRREKRKFHHPQKSSCVLVL